MPDPLTKAERSALMARIRGTNTTPEILVRSALHRAGLRFRIHGRALPGRPDLVLPKHRVVVFVHGCFWHRHGCRLATMPASRIRFWRDKFARNVARDARNARALRRLGWRVYVVWECRLRTPAGRERAIGALIRRIMAGSDRRSGRDDRA